MYIDQVLYLLIFKHASLFLFQIESECTKPINAVKSVNGNVTYRKNWIFIQKVSATIEHGNNERRHCLIHVYRPTLL